ncbi:MAG: hypothetical protein WC346_10820 [Methanogenium sp.]|jgi:hypothetical protein
MNKKIKNTIMSLLIDFASVPSLTGQEGKMIEKISKYFLPAYPFHDFYSIYKKNEPFCAFITSFISPPTYVLVVHLDRVPDSSGLPYCTVPEDKGDFIKGQLDDTIGIAIAYYIYFFSKKPVSVLFTTKEEITSSWPQIMMFLKTFSPHNRCIVPIGIDIDIFNRFPVKQGVISLRQCDDAGNMDLRYVSLFREQADYLSIPWVFEEGRSITEIGALSNHTKGELQGVHIGLPLLNYHTDKEKVQWEAVFNAIKLITSVLSITSTS